VLGCLGLGTASTKAETRDQSWRSGCGSGWSSLQAVSVPSHVICQGKPACPAPGQIRGAGERASFLTTAQFPVAIAKEVCVNSCTSKLPETANPVKP